MKYLSIYIAIIGIALYKYGSGVLPYVIIGAIAGALLLIFYEKRKGWLD